MATGVRAADTALPELASVYWRERASDRSLTRLGRRWTICTLAHTVPLVATAVVLVALNPITLPVALILLAHAWVIPELYASRGANVLRPPHEHDHDSERTALGFLGDLLDSAPRELHARTGIVVEQGEFGTWMVGVAGAVLVRPGGRRVHCYCVKATGEQLPPSDRTAHLLLALRADEVGFATVANLAFSGATWRLRRRLGAAAREALVVAVQRSRGAAAGRTSL
jgi:hypothetical protein